MNSAKRLFLLFFLVSLFLIWNPVDSFAKTSPAQIFKEASEKYEVPKNLLRALWYVESRCSQGGDHGLAGTGSALGAIERKIRKCQQQKNEDCVAWYENQKEALFEICKHIKRDCRYIRGSSAGALGPMQHMPAEWLDYGIDANKNGITNPLELYDAVESAGWRLRRDKSNFGTWEAAIYSWNPSRYFVRKVVRIWQNLDRREEKIKKKR